MKKTNSDPGANPWGLEVAPLALDIPGVNAWAIEKSFQQPASSYFLFSEPLAKPIQPDGFCKRQ
ncbi:MAG: hypothetical protein AABN33_20770, partial [Acidobacteriota bacterium]